MIQGFYLALELMEYGGTLVLKERSFRNLEKNEILIKVFCTPIHPADLMFIKGTHGNIRPEVFPIIPGMEGSGEIVALGDKIDKSYLNKRVSVIGNPNTIGTYDGLWAQYHYTKLDNVIVYDKPMPFEKICFTINALTAIGMIETLKKKKQKSVVITGAAGNVGKTFIKLCIRESINTICLVKDNEQESKLKKLGAQNILRLNDPDWTTEMKKFCTQLSVNTVFDCLGGHYSTKLLKYLPNNSTLYNFGNLEEKELNKISSSDLIFSNKIIKGWWLRRWIESIKKEEYDYWLGYIRSEIQTDSKLFETEIHETYDLEETDIAICDYLSDMSKGKIIIAPYYVNIFS